jgi:DNA-binding NarL/FixJ family response regulator
MRGDLRVALEISLREEPCANVVGTASDATGLRALLQVSRPDLVLLDSDLPGSPLTDLLAETKSLDPSPQIIVLGGDLDAKPTALAAGADIFILKGDSPRHLLAAIRQARSQQALATETNPLDTDSESGLSSSEAA